MHMNVSFPGGSRVEAAFGGFNVMTDQPVDHGGGGTAPAPFDYFLASLGTCAGLYVLRFLERRGLSAEKASLALDAIHDPSSGKVTEVRLRVTLPADFPAKYERAILNSIDLCAVKQQLEHPPAFRSDVVIEGRGDGPAEAPAGPGIASRAG